MSIQVNQFNDRKAEEELKSCPKIVRDYVKLLKEALKSQQELTAKAIGKLRAQPAHREPLKGLICQSPNGCSNPNCSCPGEDWVGSGRHHGPDPYRRHKNKDEI